MLLQIIAIPLGLFSLIFMLVNLSQRQRARLRETVTSPGEAVRPGRPQYAVSPSRMIHRKILP